MNSNIDIEEHAFYNSGKDVNLQISGCSGDIADKAFSSSGLLGISITECNVEVGDYAFSYCDDVETLKVSNCTIGIGEHAFYNTGDDMQIQFVDCELSFDDKAFSSSGALSLDILECETVMGEYAFGYNEDLETVVLGENNVEIGSYAFYNCTSLQTVKIAERSEDDSLQIILDDKAFSSCEVESVVIGRGELEVGDYCFGYCENLLYVDFLGEEIELEEYTFYGCPEEIAITLAGKQYTNEELRF